MPQLGGSVGIFHNVHNVWYGKTRWCGYQNVKKFDNILSHFDTIPGASFAGGKHVGNFLPQGLKVFYHREIE